MRPSCLALLLLPVLLLSGCSNFRPLNDMSDAPTSFANSQDVVHYLGTKGFILRPLALSSALVTRTPSQLYAVRGGGIIEVFEFESDEEASANVQHFQLERFGAASSTIFQEGPIMVAVHGSNSALLLTLSNTLGPAAF